MLTAAFVEFTLALAVIATGAVIWLTRRAGQDAAVTSDKEDAGDFRRFQRIYLATYLTAMMADWLQGPYVYALYEAYGFSRSENAMLFVCGFGSSAIVGTFVGAMADRHGRRKLAGVYCVLYIISCLTKHINSWTMLMIGRITGGIATSLLFSVFESWLVSEHNSRGFDADSLSSTFSTAMFGNSMVAVAAGELGQIASDSVPLTPVFGDVYYGGYCAPFDLSIMCLVVCSGLIFATWSENYGQEAAGEETTKGSTMQSLRQAIRTMVEQPQVLYCGVVCALFEASMFIFVFNWTPCVSDTGAVAGLVEQFVANTSMTGNVTIMASTLERSTPKPPYGHIFAAFMVMSMLGSRIFTWASRHSSIETIGRSTLLIAGMCHLVPVLSTSVVLRYFSFLCFEACVGVYFPMIGSLKGQIVPEESRSAIYNLYRLPLNAIVVAALVSKTDTQTIFLATSLMLAIAVLAQSRIVGLRKAGIGSAIGASSYRPVSSSNPTVFGPEFGLDENSDEETGEELSNLPVPETLGETSSAANGRWWNLEEGSDEEAALEPAKDAKKPKPKAVPKLESELPTSASTAPRPTTKSAEELRDDFTVGGADPFDFDL